MRPQAITPHGGQSLILAHPRHEPVGRAVQDARFARRRVLGGDRSCRTVPASRAADDCHSAQEETSGSPPTTRLRGRDSQVSGDVDRFWFVAQGEVSESSPNAGICIGITGVGTAAADNCLARIPSVGLSAPSQMPIAQRDAVRRLTSQPRRERVHSRVAITQVDSAHRLALSVRRVDTSGQVVERCRGPSRPVVV